MSTLFLKNIKIEKYHPCDNGGKIPSMANQRKKPAETGEIKYPFMSKRLQKALADKGLSLYRIDEITAVSPPRLRFSNLSPIVNGKKRATDETIAILAPLLEIEEKRLKGWRAIDEYGLEVLRDAVDEVDAE